MPPPSWSSSREPIFFPVGHTVRVITSIWEQIPVGTVAKVTEVTNPNPPYRVNFYWVNGRPFLHNELEGVDTHGPATSD